MTVPLPIKQTLVVKANGKHEVFDAEKLRASLLKAGATPESVEMIISHVVSELRDGMTTSEIYANAFGILHEGAKKIARRYSLRRAVMELGPSGFPFEDFIAEVLKANGYEAVSRQIVLGGCVQHEMDVVAWNEKKLIMVEAKFHNILGTKSDLKVALYVKARFDDLKENVYMYGGKKRNLDEGWLVTNTKFSSTAIQYGVCKNLTMIGWNYPEVGNLQDMIESAKLHPITALSSFSNQDKKLLLQNGIVLCTTIRDNPELLVSILPHIDQGKILNEINEL